MALMVYAHHVYIRAAVWRGISLAFLFFAAVFAKYVNRFLDLHLIHLAERRGRNVYYEISPDLALLRPPSRGT